MDVAPDDQVNEETLFANGDGYRNALNGVYRDMATTQMYGRELTWGFVDVMGWVYDPLTIYYDCSNHEYYDVLLGKYNDSSPVKEYQRGFLVSSLQFYRKL